jgi:hypothetical protein
MNGKALREKYEFPWPSYLQINPLMSEHTLKEQAAKNRPCVPNTRRVRLTSAAPGCGFLRGAGIGFREVVRHVRRNGAYP